MNVLKRLLWMALGYGAAVIVAALVTIGCVVAISAFPDQARFGSLTRVMGDLPAIVLYGGVYTALFGFPGWLATVVLAGVKSVSERRFFCVAGILNAVFAHLLLAQLRSMPITESYNFGWQPLIYIWSMIGGLCGGWAYWLIAGRNTGKLFERIIASRGA